MNFRLLKKGRSLLPVLFCLAALSGSAQQGRPLSLSEAISLSLQNNFDIALTRNDSLLAALDYSFANYSFLPRLNATGGLVFNRANQTQQFRDTTRVGRAQSSTLSASINLNWTLFDGLRMFIARDRLREMIKLSELQIKAQVVTTVAEVMRVYYDIVRQEQLLRAIDEQMELSSERLRLAQYRFDIGTGVKPEVLQAQIDLNTQRSARLTQLTNINRLKEQLNQLLVVPAGELFAVTDTVIAFNPNLTLDSVTTGIAATSPELLAAQQNLEVANLDLRLRRAERFPTLEFNSAYNFTRQNNQALINPFQPIFNQNRGLNYGFTASIPIFNNFATKRLIRVAELNIQSQQLIYDRSLAQINTSLALAYRDYDLFKRTLAIEEENIRLVRENVFIARERYRVGLSTFLEMRTAEQNLADALTRLIQARYNTKAAEIELMRLRGDIVR
jgi:outer membrane protein